LVLAAGLNLGWAQAQIRIGQTAGFTGPVAAGAKEITEGARLYFDAVNKAGGVQGQTIELVSLDDKFEPTLATENAKKLIDQGARKIRPQQCRSRASDPAGDQGRCAGMVKEAMGFNKARVGVGGNSDLTPAMLEGYAAAKVLVEGLKRASPAPTREKLRSALESFKRVDIGGLDYADLSIVSEDGRFLR